MRDEENVYYAAGLTTGIIIGLVYFHEAVAGTKLESEKIRRAVDNIMLQLPRVHQEINAVVQEVIEHE